MSGKGFYEQMTSETVGEFLSRVGIRVRESEINTWTQKEKVAAANWAYGLHINKPRVVKITEEPEFLKKYKVS